ncbi:A24 family peptidase [Desulfolutivibrio sp.]|uniref:A24 family peptidase n=1 Tax=Desulfolutivibrio sp. TaxID=2773296 RepID=UPI002F964207
MPFSAPFATYVLQASLAAVVIFAAAFDMRTGKIPNAVTFPAVLAFAAAHAVLSGLPGLLFSLAGCGAGLTFLLVPHLFGYLGAGDVKLMAVVGAALGLHALLTVFLFTSIAGGAHIMLHLWLSPAPSDPACGPNDAKKPAKLRAFRVRYGAAIAVGTVAAMLWNLSGKAYLSLF